MHAWQPRHLKCLPSSAPTCTHLQDGKPEKGEQALPFKPMAVTFRDVMYSV